MIVEAGMAAAAAVAAAALRSAGQTADAARALARAADWQGLAGSEPSTWQTVAAALQPPAGQALAEGPLARGQQLTEAGSATRAAITALLSETPLPSLSAP